VRPGGQSEERAVAVRSAPCEEPESSAEQWAPIAAEDARPRIPDREYVAFCKKVSKYRNPRFKREEIALHFVICEGVHSNTNLTRFYLVETAGRLRSHYYREWVIANNGRPPARGDRMALKKFKGKLFKVRVSTVVTDAYQERLQPGTQYSKVAAILELLQSNESLN
jgi:hypothetical protein